MGTAEFERSRDERKRVEMRLAHLKTRHRFERMRLRRRTGARDEFHLAAIVQNLKTLVDHLWRPPPNEPAARMASWRARSPSQPSCKPDEAARSERGVK
jgi:hypothetical protein